MNADLEHLVTLQAQDLELKHLREELAAAPKRVAAAETAHKSAVATLEAARAALAKEEALRRRHESDIEDRRNKIARLRRQLDAATSAAQVTAYEHEIAFAESSIRTLEDEELASLERSEAQETAEAEAAQHVARTETALEAERTRAADIKARNTAAISALEAERAALRKEIAAAESGERALATYDRVSKVRGTGVSEALDHKCTACQMMVRPQRWNDLTGHDHQDQIFTCETCGRMLFWDPRRDAPGPWPPGDRLAAALHRPSS